MTINKSQGKALQEQESTSVLHVSAMACYMLHSQGVVHKDWQLCMRQEVTTNAVHGDVLQWGFTFTYFISVIYNTDTQPIYNV